MKRLLPITLIICTLIGCANKDKHYDEWVVKNGKTYYFDEKGIEKKGWYLNKDNNWNYFANDGHMIENQRIKIDDNMYFFDQFGNMAYNKQIELNGKTYYYSQDGFEYKGLWKQNFYVDDFGDKTEARYIINYPRFKGSFSSYYDKKQNCEFELLIDDNNIAIIVYENYSNVKEKEIKNAFDLIQQSIGNNTKYICKLKLDDTNIIQFTGNRIKERIYIDNTGKQVLLNCLTANQKAKILLKEENQYISMPYEYLFEIEPDNFRFVYWK